MNDFRPFALTSIPIKCLEKLILTRLKQHTECGLDSLQFAYRSHRGTEDALLTFNELISHYLVKANNYARVLMIDFSSAFNTLLLDKLIMTFKGQGTPEDICRFVWDFLTNRSQYD